MFLSVVENFEFQFSSIDQVFCCQIRYEAQTSPIPKKNSCLFIMIYKASGGKNLDFLFVEEKYRILRDYNESVLSP